MRFVLLLAGRDMGRVALTLGGYDDRTVLIADGRLRKLEKPKKKKLLSVGIGAALIVAVLVTSVVAFSFGQIGRAHV